MLAVLLAHQHVLFYSFLENVVRRRSFDIEKEKPSCLKKVFFVVLMFMFTSVSFAQDVKVISIDCTGDLVQSTGLNAVTLTDTMGFYPAANWNSTGEDVEQGYLDTLWSADGEITRVFAEWDFNGDGWSQNTVNDPPEPANKNHKLMDGLLWSTDPERNWFNIMGIDNYFETYDLIIYVDPWNFGDITTQGEPVITMNDMETIIHTPVEYHDPNPVFDDALPDGKGNMLIYTGMTSSDIAITVGNTQAETAGWINGIQLVSELPAKVEVGRLNPTEYSLGQNYPNPFNPATTIEFTLEKAGHTRLTVYDVSGRVACRLVNEVLHAGRHAVLFHDATLPSGLYFYKISSGDFQAGKSMLLLK